MVVGFHQEVHILFIAKTVTQSKERASYPATCEGNGTVACPSVPEVKKFCLLLLPKVD